MRHCGDSYAVSAIGNSASRRCNRIGSMADRAMSHHVHVQVAARTMSNASSLVTELRAKSASGVALLRSTTGTPSCSMNGAVQAEGLAAQVVRLTSGGCVYQDGWSAGCMDVWSAWCMGVWNAGCVQWPTQCKCLGYV